MIMGRAMRLCSLLCLATASCTFWCAFVSPSFGGPPKAPKAGQSPRASPVVQRASTQGVSLAAPLCLLAVAAVARTSRRKAVKRHPVVLLSASRTLPPAQNSVAPSYSDLISVEDELETVPMNDSENSFTEANVEPVTSMPAAPGQSPKSRRNRKWRSSRTQRRCIGARLARPAEPLVPTKLSYDISKVRSKLQSGLCGRDPSRAACRARETRSQVSTATQGIVVYSGSRCSIFSVVHHSEGFYHSLLLQ